MFHFFKNEAATSTAGPLSCLSGGTLAGLGKDIVPHRSTVSLQHCQLSAPAHKVSILGTCPFLHTNFVLSLTFKSNSQVKFLIAHYFFTLTFWDPAVFWITFVSVFLHLSQKLISLIFFKPKLTQYSPSSQHPLISFSELISIGLSLISIPMIVPTSSLGCMSSLRSSSLQKRAPHVYIYHVYMWCILLWVYVFIIKHFKHYNALIRLKNFTF